MSEELIKYFSVIAIPTLAIIAFLFCVPKKEKELRIFSFMLLFILVRDAMTPMGLWRISSHFELRFIAQPLTLWVLAFSSLALVVLSHFVIGPLTRWGLNAKSLFEGIFGGLAIAVLPALTGQWTPYVAQEKPSGVILLAAIAALAFLGNFLEEVIYRGHFQSYLETLQMSRLRVVIVSAGLFSISHSFLAYTVTSVGWPILIFTFYEGLICAYLRQRSGLFAAVLAHGLGLFLILSALPKEF